MPFTNLGELENYIRKEIEASLDTDVSDTVKGIMKDHIESDVYNAYTPTSYVRTNKLMDNVETELIPGTMSLILRDVRMDNEKDITSIIEYGKGYSWHGNLDERIGPRPFIENTYEDILNTSDHIESLKMSLKSKGFIFK